MLDGSLPACVVRVVTADGRLVGTGVLVGGRDVVTCAHVVNLALGREPGSVDEPESAPVGLSVPATGAVVVGRVHRWTPPPERDGLPGEDLAWLVLDREIDARPARLAGALPGSGDVAAVFGFPSGRPHGAWASAVVRGAVGDGNLQLDLQVDSAVAVQRGFSGGPVFTAHRDAVAGIVVTAAKRDSYAVPATRLRRLWPDLGRRSAAGVTVLHLTGPLTEPPALTDQPDLVVFTGDMTTGGRPSEFRRGFRVLGAVAAAAGLPRDRVVVVPGTHDVNKAMCAAYFATEEAMERTPVPPFWPKWLPFAEAFEDFYDGAASFTPDEPWSLFVIDNLSLVVAAANSTYNDTHSSSAPSIGLRQLDYFRNRLADHPDDWTRLAVVHDHWTLPTLTDVMRIDATLTGTNAEPGSALLVTLAAGALAGGAPRTALPRGDAFFEDVLEATRVKHPTAQISPRPDKWYIRVAEPRRGGRSTPWPVGVARGPLSLGEIDHFVTHVHRMFAAADPGVRSELVHEGAPAAEDLVRVADAEGVRLSSFLDYRKLLDLRPLMSRQVRRLAADRVYAPERYVAQRYSLLDRDDVREDALAQVLEWCTGRPACAVVVLGDSGRGKSFLLRQLARRLAEHDAGVTPLLIELGALEKAPSLDEILAQHLVRGGVEVLDIPALRAMVATGRLVLLFDGFDELSTRVGYENSLDQLGTLLSAVDGQAKVVVAARSQHFLSQDQVLTAVGVEVAAKGVARVVRLEDFSPEQIDQYLTRHYGGDRELTRRKLDSLGSVTELAGLARNPRMLSFLADIDSERLLQAVSLHERLGRTELYRRIIDRWLQFEEARQTHVGGVPSLGFRERLEACVALALRMWERGVTAVSLGELTDTVARTLTSLADRGYTADQAAHTIGSGSLLAVVDGHSFSFVHDSVMEWLVAYAAASETAPVLTVRRMPPLMIDFYCDLVDRSAALAWAEDVLSGRAPTVAAEQNADAIRRRLTR